MRELLARIIEWGRAEARIQVMVLTGSVARGDADPLSDLDVALFGHDLEDVAADATWMARVAPVWMCLPLHTEEGYPTRLVIFDAGRKVDFSFWPMHELERMIERQALDEVYDRGYDVLLDKTELARQLPPPAKANHPRPKLSEEEFRALVEEFWFEVWHVGKYLARNDLWHAKSRDWDTKRLLLRMIEWSELSRHGWSYDTVHLGVKMKQWVDPQVWQRCHALFAHFDAADGWPALFATTQLFRELAHRTAATLGYVYPQAVEDHILGFVTDLHAGASGTGRRSP